MIPRPQIPPPKNKRAATLAAAAQRMKKPFIVIAPARLASSRLPRKPLANLGGAPMIVQVLRAAARAGAARAIAATDSAQVARAAQEAGFEAVLTGRCDSGSARAAVAAKKIKVARNTIIVNVQGDEPFLEGAVIRAVAAAAARLGVDAATAARPLRAGELQNANVVKAAADKNGCALFFSRAPILTPRDSKTPAPRGAAMAHIGVYAFRAEKLFALQKLPPAPPEKAEKLEQLRWLWHGAHIHIARARSASFGIDTPADLARARARLQTAAR